MESEGLGKATREARECPRCLGLHVIEKDKVGQEQGLDRVKRWPDDGRLGPVRC